MLTVDYKPFTLLKKGDEYMDGFKTVCRICGKVADFTVGDVCNAPVHGCLAHGSIALETTRILNGNGRWMLHLVKLVISNRK